MSTGGLSGRGRKTVQAGGVREGVGTAGGRDEPQLGTQGVLLEELRFHLGQHDAEAEGEEEEAGGSAGNGVK